MPSNKSSFQLGLRLGSPSETGHAPPQNRSFSSFPPYPEEGPDVPTYQPKAADVQRTWHVIDATDVVLGRLATQVAVLLRGKHKAYFAPHLDTGDFVVVINASKIVLTGTKAEHTVYHHHSGFPGGLKTRTFADMLATRPTQIIEKAVKGMLPHTRLGRQMGTKLKVYAGPTHPHQAQQPVPFEIIQVAQ
jgi:large subunit ribosomal protein L13